MKRAFVLLVLLFVPLWATPGITIGIRTVTSR